jgi:hypothetical protein
VKRRGVALVREVKHRRIGKLLNFLPYAAKHRVDVEGPLARLWTHTHCDQMVQGIVQKINAS